VVDEQHLYRCDVIGSHFSCALREGSEAITFDAGTNGVCIRCGKDLDELFAVLIKRRDRLRAAILEHYSTAPKAANPLLKRLGMEEV